MNAAAEYASQNRGKTVKKILTERGMTMPESDTSNLEAV